MGGASSAEKPTPQGSSVIKGYNPIPIFSPISSPEHQARETDSFSMSPRSATTDQQGEAVELISHAFKWSGAGDLAFLAGSWDDWAANKPMDKAENSFICFMDLPPGTYEYKFIVDGQWRYSEKQDISRDNKGNVNNVITLKPLEPISLQMSSSPPESYTQVDPDWDKLPFVSKKQRRRRGTGPVELPSHLERALLNTAANPEDPTILPLPHHTLLNHMYIYPGREAKEDDPGLLIFGLSVRYKKKFVTYVYHRPSPK